MHVNQHIGFPSLGHKFYGPTLNFPNISIFTTHTTFMQLQAKTIYLIIRKILQSINQWKDIYIALPICRKHIRSEHTG